MVRNAKMCFLLYRDHTKILDVIKTLVGYVVNSGWNWLSEIMISSSFSNIEHFQYPIRTSFAQKMERVKYGADLF